MFLFYEIHQRFIIVFCDAEDLISRSVLELKLEKNNRKQTIKL